MATILVALDGSDAAWKALEHALAEFGGETIAVLHVVDPTAGTHTSFEDEYEFGRDYAYDDAVERGEERLAQARERARQADALSETVIETALEAGRPARTIVEYAEEHDVDHVVVGSRGRSGISRVLLGSVAESVVRRSPVPVTVVR
jgi:nucleotide-binding universal stress UspA family protein